MFQTIYGVVKNITVFLILVNVVMNLFGNKEYLKYVSLFVGMVLILIVANPILTWIGGEDLLSSKIELSGFAADNADLEERIKMADENGRKNIWKAYKEKIKEQVEWALNKRGLFLREIDITVDEEEAYGGLVALHVTAGRTEEEKAPTDITIDKIRITEEGDIEEYDVEENVSSELVSEEIREELAALYRMEPEGIHIRIIN